MNINLNSSAEEIMAYLTLRGRIQLLNGQFFSTLWVPSESIDSVKKFINDNNDKWSDEKKHQDQETFDFYEAIRLINQVWDEAIFSKHMLEGAWKEVKEQPKTFGWDEAYRLMKEGKKIAKKSWADKKKYLVFNQNPFFKNLHAMVISDSLDSEFRIGTSHLEATDWYVYEE